MGFRSLIGVNLEYSAKNVPKLVFFWRRPSRWTDGILEYLSQTNHKTDFIDPDDKFKFIDD